MNAMSRLVVSAWPLSGIAGAMDVSRPMASTAPEIEPLEECVIVGGCGGPLCVPAAQEPDYYRAQGCVAMFGFACLFAFLFLRALF